MASNLLNEIERLIIEYNQFYDYIHKNSFEARMDIQSCVSRLLEYIRFREMALTDNVQSVSEASRTLLREVLTKLQNLYQMVLLNQNDNDNQDLIAEFERLKLELPTNFELGFKFSDGDIESIIASIKRYGKIKSHAAHNEMYFKSKICDLTKWLKMEYTTNFDITALEYTLNPLLIFVEKSNEFPLSYWLHPQCNNDYNNIEMLKNDDFPINEPNYSNWLYDYKNESVSQHVQINVCNEYKMQLNDSEMLEGLQNKTNFSSLFHSGWLWQGYFKSDGDFNFEMNDDKDVENFLLLQKDDWQIMFRNDYLRDCVSMGSDGIISNEQAKMKNSETSLSHDYLSNNQNSNTILDRYLYRGQEFEDMSLSSIAILKNILDTPWQLFLET